MTLKAKVFSAGLVLFVTIVGIGVFTLPYIVLQLPEGFLWLFLVGLVSILLNWLYIRVVIATPENLQLAGFAKKYFPRFGHILGTAAILINLNGVLLAYLVAGGDFLAGLLPLFSSFAWGLIFYLGVIIVVCWGFEKVAQLDYILALALIFLIIIFALKGMKFFDFANFNAKADGSFVRLIPIMFFSYAGFAVIPELEEIFPKNEKKLKKTVLVGSVLPIIFYFLFCLIAIGLMGDKLTSDFVGGVKEIFPAVFLLGSLMGIVAVVSSCISFGFSLKEFWQRDMSLKKNRAVLLTFLPAMVMYLVGVRNLLDILSWTGGVSTVLITIIIVGCFLRIEK